MISLIQKSMKFFLCALLVISAFAASQAFAKAEGEAETRYQGAPSGIDPTTVKEMIDTEGPPMTVDEYKTNNVLRTEVSSRDVAELAAEMCGALFAKTTGAQLPVDGGNERVI